MYNPSAMGRFKEISQKLTDRIGIKITAQEDYPCLETSAKIYTKRGRNLIALGTPSKTYILSDKSFIVTTPWGGIGKRSDINHLPTGFKVLNRFGKSPEIDVYFPRKQEETAIQIPICNLEPTTSSIIPIKVITKK
jgi:hypothetical protein